MTARATFRRLLAESGLLIQPAVATPFAAKIAEAAGAKCLALGGFAMGIHQAIGEPLLSVDEVGRITRQVAEVSDLPLMVDAGAGWGDAIHVMRTVRVLERAGAASIHIEDQTYPKRVSHYLGVDEVISIEEMEEKMAAAIEARTDPDFALVFRTDALRAHGYAEAIRRAERYCAAGADLLKLFPRDIEQARQVPKDLPGVPLVFVNSPGNRRGAPVLTARQAEDFGYKILYDATSSTNATAAALKTCFEALLKDGDPGVDPADLRRVREDYDRAIGMQRLHAIEAGREGEAEKS